MRTPALGWRGRLAWLNTMCRIRSPGPHLLQKHRGDLLHTPPLVPDLALRLPRELSQQAFLICIVRERDVLKYRLSVEPPLEGV